MWPKQVWVCLIKGHCWETRGKHWRMSPNWYSEAVSCSKVECVNCWTVEWADKIGIRRMRQIAFMFGLLVYIGIMGWGLYQLLTCPAGGN